MRTAIVYDFDGTLAPGNIQEHRIIPEYLGTTKEEFCITIKGRDLLPLVEEECFWPKGSLLRGHD